MDTKTLAVPVEVKSTDRGEVEAVFARFNVEDHDGDITVPGAFDDGAHVAISAYGHKTWPQMGGLPPVGRGTIRTTPDEAVLEGRFFLDTSHGRDAFNLVKGMGDLQEWSYGFDAVDYDPRPSGRARVLKKNRVHEVSPVFQGAGLGTRTLAVKALVENGYDADKALAAVLGSAPDELRLPIRPHTTDTSTKGWEPADVLAGLGDGASVDALRSVFALSDPTQDPDTKGAYLYAHHEGAGGAANLRACAAGIAQLNLDIKGAHRQGVYDHLAQHLRDGGREPSELRSDAAAMLKLNDRAAVALAGLSELRRAVREVDASRSVKGKKLGAMTVDILDWVRDEMRQFAALIDTPEDQAAQEFARFVSLTTRQGV